MKRRLLFATAILLSSIGSASAASYPDHAIKLIVPWAAGGDTDLIFRPFAPLLQKYLKQPVVIANVGGASGTVGEREAAGAAPDGYTVFGAHDFIHSVYFGGLTDIKYSKAFEPVCLVASTPSVITVGAKTPWKTYKELVDDAKKRPGQIIVGASLGSTSQYSIALAAKAAHIKFKYVPYDGTAKRMNALLGGHIQVADSNLTQKSKVDAGLLRFLANMADKRTPGLEDVPTLKELGYDVEYSVNRGLMVPKGTPADVKATLGKACAAAAKEPAYAKALSLQGTNVRYMDAQGYAEYLKKTDAVTKDIAKDLGLLKRE
ncbi:MAG TPA: tripartite tricarboxylate transporter substrate binding protein [Xanthobacteraceae bacterium]|jgi:tripartite-type tricarboxylate transporter receptor subunit TctC|nr:tripartite tricarboxylate transporter substrate binding protein [Xanthobacteraceae bacterium]